MAIKGKSRNRRGARASSVAPRPKIEPRTIPLHKRPAIRKAAIAGGVLLALFIAATVWGKVSRANALEDYDQELFAAQRLLLQHTQSGAPQSIAPGGMFQQFAAGQVDAKNLRAAATAWQKDFQTAATNVRALDPPDELRDANEMIAQGIDAYLGVARFSEVLIRQKELVSGATSKKQRTALEQQLQLVLAQAEDARARADALVREGSGRVSALKRAWGVGPAEASPSPGAPGLGGEIPGGIPGLPGGVPGLPGQGG
jgi:hypothetical protein